MIKKMVQYLHNLWYTLFRVDNEGVIKMNKKISIFDVANFFLTIVDRDSGSTITPLKLQKILYYAQGYHLAMFDDELFPNEFQAWAHGPANVDIYNEYKSYGYSAIDKPKGGIPLLDDGLVDFLYSIWETFGIFDGKYLEKLTHSEDPWIEARGDCKDGESCTNIISKETMKLFFKKRIDETN